MLSFAASMPWLVAEAWQAARMFQGWSKVVSGKGVDRVLAETGDGSGVQVCRF